jgi:tight adherence protein C
MTLIESLAFGVISPLLLWGIWLLVHELTIELTIEELRRRNEVRHIGKSRKVGRGTSRHLGVKIGEEGVDPQRSGLIRVAATFAIALVLFLLVVDFRSLRIFAPISITLLLFVHWSAQREKELKKRWQSEIDRELPIAVQIVAILVSSGVSPIRAIALVAENSNARLAGQFMEIVNDVKSGGSMIGALDGFSRRVNSNVSRRFANTISMALERGSPLAGVLIEFVRDARNDERTQTQRKAGKAEIGLMIPVVFLILPISVLFALWPSLIRLSSIG